MPVQIGIMPATHMIQVGDPAPNFSLKDQTDNTFGLLEQDAGASLLYHEIGTRNRERQVNYEVYRPG